MVWEQVGEHGTLQDMSILQTCPLSSTAGQQSSGSAAVDDQPQPLDLGVHEESEDEPGVYEVAPGAEVLDSNDDMDEDNEIPFEFPDGFELAQAPGSGVDFNSLRMS